MLFGSVVFSSSAVCLSGGAKRRHLYQDKHTSNTHFGFLGVKLKEKFIMNLEVLKIKSLKNIIMPIICVLGNVVLLGL